MDTFDSRLVVHDAVGAVGSWFRQDSTFGLRSVFNVFAEFALLTILAYSLAIIDLLAWLGSCRSTLFRQTCTSLNGRTLLIYKFCTMHVQEDGIVVRQGLQGDARMTRMGAGLCEASLDDLPLLLHVPRDEKGLVSLRTHALDPYCQFGLLISAYREKFAVRLGITNWTQIGASRAATRALTNMQRRLKFELWYAKNRSLALNFRI